MVKPVIVKRLVKGQHLTFTELDQNFQNLRDATISVAVTGSGTITLDLNDQLDISGTNLSITTTESQGLVSIDGSLVHDTTPQLGGNLDVNGHSLVSTANGNIVIAPNGTGLVQLDGLYWPASDGLANQVLTTNGSGTLSWTTPASVGTINSFETITVAGQSSVVADSTTDSLTLAAGSGITITTNATTDTITFSATGQDLVADTTPQLGGDLDVNGRRIVTLDSNQDIELDPNGLGYISLNGPIRTLATSGLPTSIHYIEDDYFTPDGYFATDWSEATTSWLKIRVSGTDYYLPLVS
jgi:hypothetical protein